ncbi:MAG: DNA gyrase inhibitor YacG [Pseudomonadota bacterium]
MVAIVSCPTCAEKVEWVEASKYRPFCSLRCKQIDLGAWAEEKYVIAAASPEGDADEAEDLGQNLPP